MGLAAEIEANRFGHGVLCYIKMAIEETVNQDLCRDLLERRPICCSQLLRQIVGAISLKNPA
jgi:hypothetical protein